MFITSFVVFRLVGFGWLLSGFAMVFVGYYFVWNVVPFMSNTLQDYSKKIHSDCKNVGFELLFVRFYWFEWIGGWSFV
jgi:hypothetical protein